MHSPRALFCASLPQILAAAVLATAPTAISRPLPERGPKSTATPASPTLHLTLTKAIQLAMEKNLAIKVEAFGPQIADANVVSQQGVFDPELNVGFEQQASHDTNSELRSSAFTGGIGGLTTWGATYNLGLTTSAFDYRRYQSGVGFSLTQPLLRGFGTDVNLAGLRIARNDRQSSQWAFRQQVIDVVTQTIYVYNALYSALRNSSAAIRSRDAALQLQHDEERRMELGVKTALDVTTARADAASREEAVLLAQEDIVENERFLKQLVTDDTKTLIETRVIIDAPPLPATGPIDVEAGIHDALVGRPDYQQALLDLKNRHINVVVRRNEALPRLDLNGSLNLLGLNAGDVTSSFGFLNNSSSEPDSWAAGLVFRLPLPNRTARGRLTGAKLLAGQALVGLQQMEQAIIVDVANAAGQITTSHKRINTTEEALRLAKESLEAGEERLKAGTSTTFEVLQLQQNLTAAEAAEIKAEGDYRNAVAEYDRKTGTSLQRHAITLAP